MTPEERSEERFVKQRSSREHYRAEGFATCIREQVEPLEAERDKLRALVQELAISLERCVNENGEVWGDERALIAAAKEQGFVPTNTTEG